MQCSIIDDGTNGFYHISGSLYSVDVIIIAVKPDLNDEIAQDSLVSYISSNRGDDASTTTSETSETSVTCHPCNGKGIIRIISDNNSGDIYNLKM